MNPTALEDPTVQNLLDRIADHGGKKFHNILLYNALYQSGDAASGIEGLIEMHTNLMALHGFMAGFQYVVVSDVATDDAGENGMLEWIILTLQSVGFLLSLLGTLISLVSMEFLRGVAQESPTMQVESILKYGGYFQCSDYAAVLAVLCLLISTNLSLYHFLPLVFCWAINGVSTAGGVLFMLFFQQVIVNRQRHGGGRYLFLHQKGE